MSIGSFFGTSGSGRGTGTTSVFLKTRIGYSKI